MYQWNQFPTDGRDGMTCEVIDLKGANGDTINAYYARPTGDGPFPSVVLIHHLHRHADQRAAAGAQLRGQALEVGGLD